MMAFNKYETIDFTGIPAHISSLKGSERAFKRLGGSASSVEHLFQLLVSTELIGCNKLKISEKSLKRVQFTIKLVSNYGLNDIKDCKNG